MLDTELARELENLGAKLKTAGDEAKEKAEKALNAAIAADGKIEDTIKKAADEALIKYNEIGARITELEQKAARRAADGPQRPKTAGQLYTENEEFKAWLAKGGRGRMRVEISQKAIISSLTTDANGSAGDLIVPTRVSTIFPGTERRLVVRDLLMPGNTDSNAIEYVKETGFTNLAATVSETTGPTKPQSELKFDIVVTAVTTIAHWVLATRQILADVPQLRSYIDGRLRYGLAYVEDNQLLNGGGTGTDLNGVYTQATAYSQPITPSFAGDVTKIDVLRLAMLQAFLAEYPSSGIVLHPSDWADIELTKTTDGAYLFANPQGMSGQRLWGLPVVDTQAMTVDKFLVGAFNIGAQIFDRETASVEASTEDSDNFRKNLVTILAEERLALAVYRPEAFIKGDFSEAGAGSPGSPNP
jgi:HK97 family phage major capsid protein